MERPLLILRRHHPSSLLITTLTLLPLIALTTCASVNTTQHNSQDGDKFSKTDNFAHNSHRTVTNDEYSKTKDASLSRNPTDSFVETSTKSMKNIRQIPTKHILPVETNSDLYSSLPSGLTFLKLLSSMNQSCLNASSVLKCVKGTVIRFVTSVLYSGDSYEIYNEVRNHEIENNKSMDAGPLYGEGNVTVLQETIMKQLENYEVSANLGRLANQVEDTARSAVSTLKPGK